MLAITICSPASLFFYYIESAIREDKRWCFHCLRPGISELMWGIPIVLKTEALFRKL